MPTDPPSINVKLRFPNRYTGGYNSSTTIEKLKYQTISSAKNTSLNRYSDMSGITAIASKVYPTCKKS